MPQLRSGREWPSPNLVVLYWAVMQRINTKKVRVGVSSNGSADGQLEKQESACPSRTHTLVRSNIYIDFAPFSFLVRGIMLECVENSGLRVLYATLEIYMGKEKTNGKVFVGGAKGWAAFLIEILNLQKKVGTVPNVWWPSKCCIIRWQGTFFCFWVFLWCRVSLQYGGRFYESPQAIGAQCNKPSADAYNIHRPSKIKAVFAACAVKTFFS